MNDITPFPEDINFEFRYKDHHRGEMVWKKDYWTISHYLYKSTWSLRYSLNNNSRSWTFCDEKQTLDEIKTIMVSIIRKYKIENIYEKDN